MIKTVAHSMILEKKATLISVVTVLLGLIALAVLSYPQTIFASSGDRIKNNHQYVANNRQDKKTRLSDDEIRQSFERFAKAWMAKLEAISRENSKKIRLEPLERDGVYVGRYVCYGPECNISIKRTGSKETPYVGMIYYSEKQVLKKGPTRQDALNDPGTPIEEVPVTEIFRYTKGKWVY
ncbi:hypothetical protein [Dissulfurimicrobium hydrothermale]|uniref:hypothetical protein n=1 Tax=Dissulfurimicrobium hydrothermale TaxID=1750598 RepID=UPI001EDB252F|nr:hypothetical protein [Dissulfurimicrobium hydrothermale]UKL12989.1 hypothetical protein LGS26_05690 [Dissulfurimicrobium hydrothermale]